MCVFFRNPAHSGWNGGRVDGRKCLMDGGFGPFRAVPRAGPAPPRAACRAKSVH